MELPPMEAVAADQRSYAEAYRIQYAQQDPLRGKPLAQKHGRRYLLQNRPDMPLTREEMDAVYALPYMRAWHPMYDKMGGVPALSEVQFSIAQVRGCFGACNFCALTFHQGRIVTSRSRASIVEEGRLLTKLPGLQGLHSRRRRPDGGLSRTRLRKAAQERRVREPPVPVPASLPEPEGGPPRIHRDSAGTARASGREEGVRALGHSL